MHLEGLDDALVERLQDGSCVGREEYHLGIAEGGPGMGVGRSKEQDSVSF